jgi:hypothetical protein
MAKYFATYHVAQLRVWQNYGMDTSNPRYLSDFAPGTTLRDYVDPNSGLRLLVVRGPFSFCAYIGVKADHPLAGLEELDFPCHHGITFEQWGQPGSRWDAGWYWWGWDYGHFTDVVDHFPNPPAADPADVPEEIRELLKMLADNLNAPVLPGAITPKNWTVDEVFEDGLEVIDGLRNALAQCGQLSLSRLLPRR